MAAPPADDDPRVLYAAWVRTGLVALAAGVGAKKTLEGVLPEWAMLFNASLLVPFAAFCFVAGVWRTLRPGHDSPRRSDVRRIPPALLAVVDGGLLLVSLGALLGIWLGRTGGS